MDRARPGPRARAAPDRRGARPGLDGGARGRSARLRARLNTPGTVGRVLEERALAPAVPERAAPDPIALPGRPADRWRRRPRRRRPSTRSATRRWRRDGRCGYRFHLQRVLGLPDISAGPAAAGERAPGSCRRPAGRRGPRAAGAPGPRRRCRGAAARRGPSCGGARRPAPERGGGRGPAWTGARLRGERAARPPRGRRHVAREERSPSCWRPEGSSSPG